MQALVKYAKGVGNVELRDVQEPTCGESQVKLEVEACGICGTDMHVYHDTFRNFPPVILGHEFAGHVVQVGRSVTGVPLGGALLRAGSHGSHLWPMRVLPPGRIHVLRRAAGHGPRRQQRRSRGI